MDTVWILLIGIGFFIDLDNWKRNAIIFGTIWGIVAIYYIPVIYKKIKNRKKQMKKFFNDAMYWFIIGMILMAFGFFLLGMLIATGIATIIETSIGLFKKNKVTT